MEPNLDSTPLLSPGVGVGGDAEAPVVVGLEEEEEEKQEGEIAEQRRTDDMGPEALVVLEGEEDEEDDVAEKQGSDLSADEKSASQQLQPGQRKRVCCCVSCVVMAMVSLVTTLFILHDVVPAMIQENLHKSSFRFTTIINMTQPGNNSFTLTAGLELTASSPVPATLVNGHGGDVNIYFYNETGKQWRCFGTMRLPDIKLKAGSDVVTDITLNEVVRVTDMEAWSSFNAAVMLQDTFDLRFRSLTTALHIRGTYGFLGMVFSGLTLSKEATLAGAGGLKDLEVVSYDAVNGPDAKNRYGLDVLPTQIATIRTMNVANVSLQPLGVLAMEVMYKGGSMGWVRTDPAEGPVSYLPGLNQWTARGPMAIANITLFEELMGGYMTGEPAELTVTFGNHVATPQEAKSWGQRSSSGTAAVAAGARGGQNIPCTTERLYEAGLKGLQFAVKLRYPGPRLNLTTQSIVDLDRSIPKRSPTRFVSQLWLGILNPFSMDVIVDAIHIDTFWDKAADPSAALTQNYDNGKFIPLKPKDVTLAGTSSTSASNQLISLVPYSTPDEQTATNKMKAQLTYDPSNPDSGHMLMRSSGWYSLRIGLMNVTFKYYQGNTATCSLKYVRGSGSCLGQLPNANTTIHNAGSFDL